MNKAIRRRKPRATKTIAITGGKGGVGKSNIALNLAVSLGKMGRNVVLMDADLGLANLDLLLGVSAKYSIKDLLSGGCALKDILIEGPQGIRIVPAASGFQHMAELNQQEHAGIINAFTELGGQIDYLIIDTAAGISQSVVNFVKAAQEVLLVVLNEPTSIADAYALLKLMNQSYDTFKFHVVANMVKDANEGQMMFNKLNKVVDRFLDVALEFSGSLPFDESVKKSVKRQKPFVDLYPNSKAAAAMQILARKVDHWPLLNTPRGHLEFFIDQLIEDQVVG